MRASFCNAGLAAPCLCAGTDVSWCTDQVPGYIGFPHTLGNRASGILHPPDKCGEPDFLGGHKPLGRVSGQGPPTCCHSHPGEEQGAAGQGPSA